MRQMWHLLQPIHALVYYASEVFDEMARLGHEVDTRWPSYLPLRAAPLGPASPELVAATFYSFSPDIEVSDVDALRAVLADQGAEIVYAVRDEPWGVRRFFVRDPDGKIVNVLTHR